MKTISGALLTNIQSETPTLATLWKITRTDGQVFRFTDHDTDIVVTDGTYIAKSGYSPTTIVSTEGLSVDNLTLETILDADAITETDLISGKFDYADVEIYQVNWASPSWSSKVFLKRGTFGEVKTGKVMASVEFRGLSQHLNQVTGRMYTLNCDTDLGSTRCGASLVSYTVSGAVTAVIDSDTFRDNSTADIINKADGWFSYGLLTWLTGNNAGRNVEVKKFTVSGSDFTFDLIEPMWDAIQVGDTFSVYAGCDKTFETCKTKFSNGVNFQGFQNIPNSDTIFSYK